MLSSISSNLFTVLLVLGVLIFGSIQHITIPLFVNVFESLYFLLLITSLEGCILYTTLYCITLKIVGGIGQLSWFNGMTLMMIGIIDALFCVCFIYGANPERTPVIFQSIFLGLAIVPSAIFTRLLLKKEVKYCPYYIMGSMLALVISITVACIPIYQEGVGEWYWSVMYLIGIILMSLSNVLQEKYMIDTGDGSFVNKLRLASYTGIAQLVSVFCLVWVDLFIGYDAGNTYNATGAFVESVEVFFTDIKTNLIIQFFIVVCLVSFVLSIYLNEISTNYNMILTNLTNQSVALFFVFFPELNHGVKNSLFNTLISVICSCASVYFWFKGETQVPKKDEKIELNSYGTFDDDRCDDCTEPVVTK